MVLLFVFTRRRAILPCLSTRARHRWQGQELDARQLPPIFLKSQSAGMNQSRWLILIACVALNTGCRSLFTSGSNTAQSHWKDFPEAKAAFDQIVPGQSTTEELECLGFDPFSNSNVKILTYLDVTSRFIPNNSVQKSDLPETVRKCLEAKNECQAYELDLTVTRSKRYGNLFLDVFGFNRKTRETGWNFKALIVLNAGKVVYKLWSGEPNLERYETRKKPLGPLQELEGVIRPSIPVP